MVQPVIIGCKHRSMDAWNANISVFQCIRLQNKRTDWKSALKCFLFSTDRRKSCPSFSVCERPLRCFHSLPPPLSEQLDDGDYAQITASWNGWCANISLKRITQGHAGNEVWQALWTAIVQLIPSGWQCSPNEDLDLKGFWSFKNLTEEFSILTKAASHELKCFSKCSENLCCCQPDAPCCLCFCEESSNLQF